MESSAEDWRDTGCVGVVETELEMLEIEALGEPSVTYIVSSRGSVASEGSEELNGWVSFENCKGNLNVQLTESCSVEMMYTSGQCQIPGISHY
jgi:hypothetical protein